MASSSRGAQFFDPAPLSGDARLSRDAPFSAFVAEQGEVLAGAAYLMLGDAYRADQRVQSVLARLYAGWPRWVDPRVEAFRLLAMRNRETDALPWAAAERFELLDRPPPTPVGIARDLLELTEDQRRVLVLESFARLPLLEVAVASGMDAAQVEELLGRARAQLRERDAGRSDSAVLTEQLRVAAAMGDRPGCTMTARQATYPGATHPGAAQRDAASGVEMDPASAHREHGRQLIRRRRFRTLLIAGMVTSLAAFGLVQLRPERPVSAPPPTLTPAAPSRPTPSSGQSECDTTPPSCRVTLVRTWRSEMAEVAVTYVDPERQYFSGYSYSYNAMYDTDSFWSGSGGRLGVDLFRALGGGSEIYLQIATDRDFAIGCGHLTKQKCFPKNTTNGQRVWATATDDIERGLEVQYSPNGREVITLVARHLTKGDKLALQPSLLLELSQDPRLRLPRV